MFHKKLILLFFLLNSMIQSFGQSNGIPKATNKFVNNFSKEFPLFLSKEEDAALELKLKAFSKSTSNQIVIVIIDDLSGLESGEFATQLGKAWGVGQKIKNNGIVVLIKPNGNSGERKFFIAVGLGLEDVLSDSVCTQINENFLLPNLKKGDYYIALDKTTDELMKLAQKKFNSN